MKSLTMKLGSFVSVVVMVTVAFQQLQSAGGLGGFDGSEGLDQDEDWESSRPVTLSAGQSISPSVSATDDGLLQVAWVDTRSGSSQVYQKRSADGGSTFTSDKRLSEVGSQPSRPSVAVSIDGKQVGVAWDAMVDLEDHSGRAVLFRYSGNGGSTFQQTTFVMFGTSPQLQFYGGDMILSFIQDDWANGTTYLRVLRVPHGTQGQVAVGDLASFQTSGSTIRMAVDGSTLHVVWDEMVEERLTVLHASVDLSSGRVDGAHLVSLVKGTLLPDSIAVSTWNGRVVVAWSERRSGVAGIFAARSGNGGMYWGATVAVTDLKSNAANPTIATNSTGRLFIVWQDDRLGPWQLYGRAFWDLGLPFGVAVRLTHSNADVIRPAVSVDANNNIYLFWQDRRDGRWQLFMDSDMSLRRPLIGSILTFTGRLPLSAFAPPERSSRLEFLELLRDVRSSIRQSEEQEAVLKIKTKVLPRMDGSLGLDPSDDLLVDPKAQAHLAWSFSLMLKELDPSSSGSTGTRSGGGQGGTVEEEPLPPDYGFSYTDYAPVFNITVSNITSTTAKISWETDPPDAYSTWLNWGPNTTMGNQVFAPLGNPWNVTLSDLEPNTTYYYGIQAVKQITPPPPMYVSYDSFYTGVIIEDMDYYVTSASNATVWWETNIPSTTVVRYNTTEDYGLSATGTNGTLHWLNLTGLDPRNVYHFQVESTALSDPALWKRSADSNFTTHLLLTNLSMKSTAFADGAYGVTLTWNSSRNATAEVRYGATSLYGMQTNGTQGRVHNVTLWNLGSATTYYYQARSVGLENANDSDAREGTPFATPPISVFNITVNATSESAEISWETNYNGTAMVRCGETANYTNNQTGDSGTKHSVTIWGLSSSTTHHFRVESTSLTNSNDTAIGLDRTFTTKGILVSNVQTPTIGVTTATVNWTTNIAGTSLVRYGRNSIWEYAATGANGTTHSVILTDLLPDTNYQFRVESSSLSNLNDTNVSLLSLFKTAYSPNDADSGQDAGNTIMMALPVEPGSHVGREEHPPTPPNSYDDPEDFYRFKAFGNQTIAVRLVPPPNLDLDLYLYGPNFALIASSVVRLRGGQESILATAPSSGFYYIEVRFISSLGLTSGYYFLTFNTTGGGPEKLVDDVGIGGDGILLDNLPGVSIDLSTGWGGIQSSGGRTYRDAPANATFYLNLHRHSHEKYTDWLVTFQYFASGDTNVSVYNGAGWVNVTTLPGRGNWWTWSFVMDHTLFYDKLPATIGINVALRFADLVQIDSISAIAYGYTTYVGHGSDDNDTLYHSPGILTGTGWVDTGKGYRDGSNCSELILNVPDRNATYNVVFRFKGDVAHLKVEQYDGHNWIHLATLVSFGMDNYFNTNQTAYYDAYPLLPGMNLRVRFVAEAVREFTYASMHIVRWFDEVGVPGDNALWLHEPGMSLYPNGQWGPILPMNGRFVRYGQRDAEVYLNAPLGDSDYVVYITYNTSTVGGQVKQWKDGGWEVLGDLTGDGQWHTGRFRTNSSAYWDYYGSEQLNIMLHFTVALYLDRMWAEPVIDGDHITEYGKTRKGPEGDPPVGALPISFNFPVYESGTFTFYGNSQITFSGAIHEERLQTFTLNNTVVYEFGVCGSTIQYLEDCVYTKTHKTHTFPFGFKVHLMAGPKTMKVEGDGRILDWRFVRLTTDPDLSDADGDGLNNHDETTKYHTSPIDPDTDGDGLTDFDEVATFSYWNDSAIGYTANVTFNITVEAFARYHVSVNTDATPSGSNVSAQVYLDGQLKASKNNSEGWSGHLFSFVVSMARGLHSLQVQRGSGSGTVEVHYVLVSNVETTSPLFADSDRDGLTDGEEVKGTMGFYTSPANADTDGDMLLDGNDELKVKRTDPTNADTDRDGFNDIQDRDPLHDLTVQVWLKQLLIQDDCEGMTNCLWYGEVGINGDYTRGRSTDLDDYEGRGNHYISVNVPDDQPTARVVIKAFRNDPSELDLTQSPGTNPLVIDYSLDENVRWGYSRGDESRFAAAYYEIRTVKFGKTNTVLMTPNDWSTVLNGSTGMHRFTGEQRFAVLNVNTVDAEGAEAYWNMETTEWPDSVEYFKDLTGNLHRARRGDMGLVQGYRGKGLHMDPGWGNTYPYVADDSKLDFAGEMTVSFWVKPDVTYGSSLNGDNWYWAVQKYGSWLIGWYGQGVHGLKFAIYDGNMNQEVQAAVTLNANTWYHIVGTYDGMNMTIYLDSQVVVSDIKGDFPIFASDHALIIGRFMAGDTYCDSSYPCYDFDGVMDEVALYGRALNGKEVGLINGSVMELDMDTRTSAWYGQWFKDLSGHGNDAGIGDHSRVVTGERGLAIQTLEDSYLYVNGRGIDVNNLTLSVRLFWLGGAGVQTIALAKDSGEHRWGTVMYSLGIADSQGTIMYGLGRQDGGGFMNTTATGAKLPPNQWHLLTLTYDGRYSRLFIDGAQVHSKDWTYTYGLIHPPDPDMFLSRCPGGVQFNGYLDDLTLWNRSLSQGEIRAQYYLDRGLNGIVVPRGLFFNSEFFESLNTTTWSYSNPLLGSMVMGNDNPLELNSRVVQQLIAANLTLEEAWTWLNKLMKNETGKVTSFPLVVTSEIYTIGFDAMLRTALPNMTGENSGNSSEPPPPIREPTFWEKVWNSFTGLVSAVWNAVVAVATFVANVILAVVKWGIGLAVAIATGQGLQYIYDTVVKPFVDLILWFINWIWNLCVAMIRVIFQPLLDWLTVKFRTFASNVFSAVEHSSTDIKAHGFITPQTNHTMWWALFDSGGSSLFNILVLISGIVAAVVTIIAFLVSIICPAGSALVDTMVALFVAAWSVTAISVLTAAVGVTLENIRPSDYFGVSAEQATGYFAGFASPEWATILATLGFLLSATVLSEAIPIANDDPTGLFLAVVAFVFALMGFALALMIYTEPVYKNLGDLEKPMAVVFGFFSLLGIWFCSMALAKLAFLKATPFSSGAVVLAACGIIAGAVGVFATIALLKKR